MSSLNRREEVDVPSLPFEFTKTATPPEDVPLKMWSMKQLPLTLLPAAPIQITLLAFVTPEPASLPIKTLKSPLVRLIPAGEPTATLTFPLVRLSSALAPIATLLAPLVRLRRA